MSVCVNVVYVMCLCGEFEEVYTHTHTPDIVYYVVYNISAHRVSEAQEGEDYNRGTGANLIHS